MADFNDNLRSIGAETRALQAVHLTAKTRSREEIQKVDTLKAEIAELTANKDVGHLLDYTSACWLLIGAVPYCMTMG